MESVFTSSAANHEATTLLLPSAMTIETVGEVVVQLLAFPHAAGGDLILDATQTRSITTPGIQCLLTLGRAFEKMHGQFFVRESDHLISRAFAEAGITPPFIGV
jgi:hypothetical protein